MNIIIIIANSETDTRLTVKDKNTDFIITQNKSVFGLYMYRRAAHLNVIFQRLSGGSSMIPTLKGA